jgi:hypothetical protein
MSASTIINGGVVTDDGPGWHVVGTGDFYHDGRTAILLQNDSGQLALWDMIGTTIVQGGLLSDDPGSAWRIKGTGDLFGDGHTDIVLQNDAGEVAVWDMNGTTIINGGVIADDGPAWHVVGTGDFNSDGLADIVLQNDDGSIALWEMHGPTIAGGGLPAQPSVAWRVIGNDSMQFIQSGPANEVLTATPIVPEEFVFLSAAAGAHTITGFNPTQDIIELGGAQFANFAAVQAATTAVGGGAVIDLGHDTSLLLAGVAPASLHAADFALG